MGPSSFVLISSFRLSVHLRERCGVKDEFTEFDLASKGRRTVAMGARSRYTHWRSVARRSDAPCAEDAAPGFHDLLAATDENKRKCKHYIASIAARGGTDAAPSLKSAFDLKPDLIYFMIDPTDFTKKDMQSILALAHARSGGKIPIQVIAFEQDEDGRIFCQSLADMTGGKYRLVDAGN